MEFTVADEQESEKPDKYLHIKCELNILLNMKVKVIPVIVGTLGTVPKNIVKSLDEHDFEN